METGFWALAFGLAVMGIIRLIGPEGMKVAGGLLVVFTVIAMALQILGIA